MALLTSRLLFLIFSISLIPRPIWGSGTVFSDISSCGLFQYFDTNSMACQNCPADQITDNSSLSCICRPGYRQNTTAFDNTKCEACSATNPQMVISTANTCIQCPSETPTSVNGRCDCPPGSITVDTGLNGDELQRRTCVQCSKGFVPNERKLSCVSCTSPRLSFELIATCIDLYSRDCTQTTGVASPPYCLRLDDDFLRSQENALAQLGIGSTNDKIGSAFFLEYHRLAISYTQCSRFRRSSYCSLVMNLCVLRGSSANLEGTDRICTPIPSQISFAEPQNMIVTDTEVETKLPPINFVTDRSREMSAAGTIYSFLDLRAATFNINGTFEGWTNASDGFLQLCQNKKRFGDAWMGFGVNYVMRCQISARDLWRKFTTKYYQLYIVYPERDERATTPFVQMQLKKFIVPVKMTSPSGVEAAKWLSRFFMVDNISLKKYEMLPKDGPTEIVRYASKIMLRVRVNGTDGILPPQLLITYSDAFIRNIDDMIDIEFAVNYEASGATFDDIVKMLLISLIAVGIYVGIKLYGWFQRRGGDCDQGACLIPSIMLIIAGGGNVLTLVALVVSIWYLIAYKFQDYAVFMLPSKDEGEKVFIIIAIVALACKFFHCVQLIVQQSTIDIFFLDWEQPKLSQVVSLSTTTGAPATPPGATSLPRTSSVVRSQPKPAADESKAPVREHVHPVSVWRTLFVGNEWNELQIIRRTSPVFQILVVATIIEFFGLGNMATGDPYVDTDLSPKYYHSEFRRVLRFGITSSFYLIVAVAQWIFFMFIYERWVEDPARNFVDLCALSNISVFILAEQRHGYYIHGRLLHGHADTNQKDLAEFLRSEARDESPKGGLFGSAQRTFEIVVPLRIRTRVDFYLSQIKQATGGGRQRSARGTPGYTPTDYQSLHAAQEDLKFLPYQVEALGRLSDWSRLETCLRPPDSSLSSNPNSGTVVRSLEWPVGFWSAVVSLRKGDAVGFNDAIASLRRAELGPLSAASLEAASYVRGYDSIVKMHVLSELEMLAKYLLSQSPTLPEQSDSKSSSKLADTLALFDVRLALTEKSLAAREPLLQFRRLATKLLAEDGNQQVVSGLNSRIGRLWLASARLARKAGRYETAYGHILAANTFADPGELRLETAKWLWARGSREDALTSLERWLTSKNSKDQLNARMLCLWTRYNEETAMLDSASLVKQYRAVVESNPRSEESYFYLAKYLSKLLLTASEQPGQPQPSTRNSIGPGSVTAPVTLPDGSLTLEAIRNFGQSLRYGSKFIFESMPQLISLWLDYALAVHNYSLQPQPSNSVLQSARQTMMGINAEMRAMLGPVPAYQFLIVFPQLISRICHPQRETAAVLLEVLAYVMSTYPQQTTWLAIAVSRSMWPLRRKRCEELFARLRQMKSELNQFISDISRLTDRLCEVCDKATDRDPESDDSKLLPLSVSRDFRQLKRLVEEQSFSRILIPLQHLLWPTLPTTRRGNPASTAQYQAFPNDEIYFAGFGEEVEVMRSLQRPKRLLVRGSNGKLYGFLCKPKEDLRKDSRWMEYVTVVNSLLGRDPDASRRRLSIRTFAVIPLNEDCGIIEWVDHTHGIRPLVMSIYRERGILKDQKFLVSCKLPADAPLSEKLKVFKTRLLPSHPAVLGDWFRRNWFADASAWHEARLAFSRSAAVMSIAGYILGLGDRHGENILIDAKSGEVVHVDFSCLFNKADGFEYPEVVPFRLTHNMLHAMGPTGYEGVFRKACEVTMRIMRHHSDALMIVLKSFVHDPLVEWQKPAQNSSKSKRTPGGEQAESGGEVVNSQAVRVLSDTRNRLKGCVTSSSVDLPLSIEGHVNYVIRQATDESNLARMYIGWGPQL